MNVMAEIGRRAFLAGLAALLAAPARAAESPPLTVLAAPANSSLLLARAVEAAGGGLTLRVWRSPDELRAAIVSGQARIFSLPINVAANLRNRGLPIRLIQVLALGPMAVLTRDPAIRAPEDLRGRRVRLYFRNDMPDLSFRVLMKEAGLVVDRDVIADYAGSATETAQLLLAGKAETALLNEPAASAALLAASTRGVPLHRAFTLQDVWGRTRTTPLPLAGLAATESVLSSDPEAIRALVDETARAAAWALAHREEAGALGAKTLGFDATALTASLDAGVQVVGARTARPDIEAFLGALAGLSPDIIGGHLPDDEFYAEP